MFYTGGLEKLRVSGYKVSAIVKSDDPAFMMLLKETKEITPEMELQVIEGSDHWTVIEKPRELYDVLMSFLAGIDLVCPGRIKND